MHGLLGIFSGPGLLWLLVIAEVATAFIAWGRRAYITALLATVALVVTFLALVEVLIK